MKASEGTRGSRAASHATQAAVSLPTQPLRQGAAARLGQEPHELPGESALHGTARPARCRQAAGGEQAGGQLLAQAPSPPTAGPH